jgi:hypothetical protein
VFLPMTISINKGINDHRQKTGNKSGEQTDVRLESAFVAAYDG